MNLEDFMADVESDMKMGGITPGQAYMRALNRKLPELVDQVKDDLHLNPAADLANLHEFLFLVRIELRKRPAAAKVEQPTDGWGAIRPGDRKGHYYREGMSLCRKVGFYFGPLEPEDDTPSRDDCAACRKLLDKEKARSVTA